MGSSTRQLPLLIGIAKALSQSRLEVSLILSTANKLFQITVENLQSIVCGLWQVMKIF